MKILEMPTSGMARQEYELQRIDYAAPEAGGRIGGVQAGFPLWQASWSIGRIGADKSDELRAFLLQLRGATRRFLGRDLARPYPRAHIAGFSRMTKVDGTPFTGSAGDWSETITGDDDSEITLEDVPAGLILSTGDYVGFKWTATDTSVAGLTWHACVRLVEGGMADETGTITVTAEPAVPLCVPEGATAYLDKPACVMALLTEQSKLEAIDRRLAVQGGNIVAVQDLRA